MPWPAHYHVEFGGRRGEDTDEIWQCGIRVAAQQPDETEPYGDPLELLDDKFGFVIRQWFTSDAALISPGCFLDWCALTWVLPTGAPDRALSVRSGWPIELRGGGALGQFLPYQSALVLSWLSDTRSHGPASRGRIYSPAPVVSTGQANGLFDPAQAAGAADAASELVEGLSVRPFFGTKLYASIVSPLAGGVVSRIDRVIVDNRLDVLRKRAARLEPYSATAEVGHDIIDP